MLGSFSCEGDAEENMDLVQLKVSDTLGAKFRMLPEQVLPQVMLRCGRPSLARNMNTTLPVGSSHDRMILSAKDSVDAVRVHHTWNLTTRPTTCWYHLIGMNAVDPSKLRLIVAE